MDFFENHLQGEEGSEFTEDDEDEDSDVESWEDEGGFVDEDWAEIDEIEDFEYYENGVE